MAARRLAAALEHIEEAGEIGVGISMRIDERVTYARLRGEMDHGGKPLRGKQRGDARAISNVALLETKRGKRGKLFKARALQGRIVIAVEIVEPDDGPALLQQPACHVVADESRCAGDQDGIAHGRDVLDAASEKLGPFT